jgi:hypothetical protein
MASNFSRCRINLLFAGRSLACGLLVLLAGGCPLLEDGEINCFDGKDNDGDQKIDFADEDCQILDLLDFFGFDIPLTDFDSPQVNIGVTEQPSRETLTVGQDGCVMAHCGCFCNLTPGAMVTIDCGKHAVLFLPGGWGYTTGFWQRLGGGTGTINKMADPPNAPPQRSALTLGDDQLCAFEAPTIPNLLDSYDIQMKSGAGGEGASHSAFLGCNYADGGR